LHLGRTHIQGLAAHQKTNDQAKQAQNRAENLDDENANEPVISKK
jgi:hypothetical protein